MNDANLDSLVERTVSNAMQQNQNQFLSDMKNVIQNQFERMEERVTNSQREMNDFQLKRLQSLTNESYVFKRKGNEAQFKFNNEVKGRLDLADTCLKDNPEQGSEKALSYISEGIELLNNRQKLVKLADMSDNGWRVVQEYETHQLASDSDDEKRIVKAEAKAAKKVREEKSKKRAARRWTPWNRGFLRYDELSSFRCKDVTFHDDFVKIYIAKSKTDQYRNGDEILVSKGKTSACPVLLLRKYFDIAEISCDSDHFLFKPMFGGKGGPKLIYQNKKLSYTRTKECIIGRLNEVVTGKNFGLHSLRAGGATAASSGDVNERCWKRHGRWRSDSAKDGYVVDSISKRLSVSQKLGL
ncbi:hypothetical protein FSP39_011534 [Pinctada imbricata]|uniref:Tyr recombinase domain-containing protein n=1 Tax=Pinctada imbricata TaxID=66713 RepID=A0AA89BP27_PINIB|nr:hypothetical protein FSP39_011534 [Pinctada imbricata]